MGDADRDDVGLPPVQITELRLRHYRSVREAIVRLPSRLTYLVGPNGTGKSNVVNGLRLVSDSLTTSLDQALRERGGIQEIRWRSRGRQGDVSVDVVFAGGEMSGSYGFTVRSRQRGGFEVLGEACSVTHRGESRSRTADRHQGRPAGSGWSERVAGPALHRRRAAAAGAADSGSPPAGSGSPLITVASVVEGHGEVTAVPELIRRIAFAHGVWDVQAPRSHRLARAKFLDAAELGRAVEPQSRRVEDRGGVVAVLDADDDCAVKLADRILAACQGQRPFAPVASVREYESVFLVAHGVTPAAAEVVRDAKGEMKRLLGAYRETIDQAKLSATLDLDRARECRWFRKFEKELLAILRG